MNLRKFGLITIVIYSCIVYVTDITIGLWAGLMVLAFLLVILPFIIPEERKISRSDMLIFGKMEIKYGLKYGGK